MQIFSRSHKGLVRSTNQDAIFTHPTLFGVADGMGGHLGGDTASKLATEVILSTLADKNPSESILRTSVEAANRRVFEKQRTDSALRGMGTTLTFLWESDIHVLIAHVGDSRAYLLRDKKLQCITDDHSVVGEMLRNHVITVEEAKTHPYRNVITRAIGTAPIVEVDTHKMEKKPNDVWFLCSDGLYNKIENSEIEKTLRSKQGDQAAEALLQMALDRGAEDNVSLLIGYVSEESAS